MKITQEVRDFAAKQNAGVDSFIAATPLPLAGGVGGGPDAVAEAGMEEMSKVFKEKGGEVYLPAE